MKNQIHPLLPILFFFLIGGFVVFHYYAKDIKVNKSTPVNMEIASEDGELILVGRLNREAWDMEAYRDWFNTEYEAYIVDEATEDTISCLLMVTLRIYTPF